MLILGATGVVGQVATQVARQPGAKRIIAAGRKLEAVAVKEVDAIFALGQPEEIAREAFAEEASEGIDVVIDYLWGRPTELLLEALARGFRPSTARSTRLLEVGESAGKTINLPGATLRSIDLKLMGSGFGSVPLERVLNALLTLFSLAAAARLRVAVGPVPLAEVEGTWNRVDKGRRIVFTVPSPGTA